MDLNRHLLEHYYTTLQTRVLDFQTKSTAERYDRLIAEHPTLEEQVPLGMNCLLPGHVPRNT